MTAADTSPATGATPATRRRWTPHRKACRRLRLRFRGQRYQVVVDGELLSVQRPGRVPDALVTVATARLAPDRTSIARFEWDTEIPLNDRPPIGPLCEAVQAALEQAR